MAWWIVALVACIVFPPLIPFVIGAALVAFGYYQGQQSRDV